jgi:hypothetical protein
MPSPRPSLRAYLTRVGAVEKNFQRYVIEEDDAGAYTRKRVLATVLIKNGTVKCDKEKYAPTEDERKLIEAEVLANPFPTCIPATEAKLRKRMEGIDPSHYCVFRGQWKKSEILFVQLRIDGEKPDLPLTHWSDGEWRFMEPDGPLPLFGLEQIDANHTVFVHEGAKAARDVRTMLNKKSAHPWAEYLKDGAHLGWAGGAEHADRVDWSPLKKLPPHRPVIVVCDNDQVGMDALTKISSILRRAMLAIIFDDRFPTGFDLADLWPMHNGWWPKGNYRGPTFDECLSPATWATEIVRADRKGRPTYKIRKQFAAEWVWVEDPAVFVHRHQTNRLRTDAVFNRTVRPFSDAEDTARLLVRHLSSKCDGIAYDPGQRIGVVNIDGKRLINCYRASAIVASKGDPAPFLEFIQHLIPDADDRTEVLRWCATLIARPEIRMSYGVLLISQVQGVGKGTLGEAILTPLVGAWNVSFPDEQQVTESAFNSWLAHKRLAVIHEIYAGQSTKAYNRLKSVITDRLITVNEKYMPSYTLENRIHVFACSNSTNALRLDDDDRRWLVPRVTEDTQPAEYWRKIHEWLNDEGLPIIKGWADAFLQENEPIRQGEHAPPTTAKGEVIEEGRSEGQRLAFDLGERVRDQNSKIILAVEDIRDWVARRRELRRNDPKLERSLTLRKALRAAGLKEPLRQAGSKHRRFQITATCKSHIVANFDIPDDIQWDALKAHYRKPDQLEQL